MKVGDVFYKKCTVTEMSKRVPGTIAEYEEENFDIKKHDAEILRNAHNEHIKTLGEQIEGKRIKEYLQNRERMFFCVMNELSDTAGTELYKETRAKHIELLHILENLGIKVLQ